MLSFMHLSSNPSFRDLDELSVEYQFAKKKYESGKMKRGRDKRGQERKEKEEEERRRRNARVFIQSFNTCFLA